MRIKTIPIFAAFFIMGFGDAVGTLVGFVQEEFAISPAMAGLLPLAGFLAYGIFSVPFGVLGEKKGKKAVLLISLAIVLAGELIPVLSIERYLYVLVAIFLIGLGMTGLQVAGNPMMRDVSAPGNYSRNLTFAQFIKSIGSNTAPYVVPLVVALGLAWEAIFSIYALVAAGTLLTVAALRIGGNGERGAEEVASAPPATVRTSFALLKDPYVAAMVGAIFLYVGAEVGMNSWIATYLQRRFGFDIASMATLGIGFFLTSLAVGRLLGSIVLNFLSPRRFFVITSVLATLGVAGLFLPSRGMVIASIFLAGLAFGNIFPLIFSIAIDDMPHRSSELSGLMVMAIVGGAVVPSLMGLVAEASVTLTFVIPLAIFIYITILSLRVASGGPGGGQAGAAAGSEG
ncbi:MAG: MFS transporter [bacterium]